MTQKTQWEQVLEILDQLKIPYNLVEHRPVFTTDEADEVIMGIEGVRTKSLFLCNKKSTAYYLLVMDGSKRLDMKKLEALISDKGIHFCSPEKLLNKMGLTPGTVSLFGLINNKEKDIQVLFDKEMLMEEYISFHPNDNTKTVFISMEDMYRFTCEQGFDYKVIEL